MREELKFARFIIRLQQNFANGLKNGFLTHLKLKGISDKLNIKEQNFYLEFNVPTNFYELRENQKLELKVNNFTSLVANQTISSTYSQKKYLGWSDTDVKANREFLRKDKELEWELAQIVAGGPNWREQMISGGGAGGAPADASGAPGGSSAPPSFGSPASDGAPPEGEAPPADTTEAPPAAAAPPA